MTSREDKAAGISRAVEDFLEAVGQPCHQHGELALVELGAEDALEAPEYIPQIRGQRVEMSQVQMGDIQPALAGISDDRLFERIEGPRSRHC